MQCLTSSLSRGRHGDGKWHSNESRFLVKGHGEMSIVHPGWTTMATVAPLILLRRWHLLRTRITHTAAGTQSRLRALSGISVAYCCKLGACCRWLQPASGGKTSALQHITFAALQLSMHESVSNVKISCGVFSRIGRGQHLVGLQFGEICSISGNKGRELVVQIRSLMTGIPARSVQIQCGIATGVLKTPGDSK